MDEDSMAFRAQSHGGKNMMSLSMISFREGMDSYNFYIMGNPKQVRRLVKLLNVNYTAKLRSNSK